MTRSPEVHIVSASAGTGKTTRLAEILEQAVVSGKARPEAVMLTTFTTKAAAELEERVRARLLGGRADEALRLGAARIGTVHSLCVRLVGEFALDLGLSPDIRTLDERSAGRVFRQALSAVVGPEDERLLAELQESLDGLDLPAEAARVVDLARENGLEAEDLARCAARSVSELEALLPPASAEDLDGALRQALEAFVAGVRRDTTRDTLGAVDRARSALQRLRQDRRPPWRTWLALAHQECGSSSRGVLAPVRRVAALYASHPALRHDLRAAVELVFGLAARAMRAYQERKRAAGVLDFADQEALALDLLRQEHVREALRTELDLLLVDEFQDTSPLQLALFLELAKLARRSVWVGDPKQAIYGFRGTDPALMEAALEALGEGSWENLDRCYRSRAELVRVTSAVFVQGFAGLLPPERVAVEAAEGPRPELGPCLEYWRLEGDSVDEGLAATLRGFLDDPEVRVRDLETGAARRPTPRDVAVLCLRNSVCAAVARELERVGIPASLARAGLLGTAEGLLIQAGLRLWADARDTLARSELARLTVFADRPEEWLEAVLADSSLAGVPAVAGVVEAREAWPQLGPVEAFDRVLEAVSAREWCLGWGGSERRLANLEALRALAVLYAEECLLEGRGRTVAGLVAFLEEVRHRGEDAQAVAVGEDAVTVVTWHSSKGLEWPVTVLYDLDQQARPQGLGVSVQSDRVGFDLADPLGGRWIRFWPDPLHSSQTAFHPAAAATPASPEKLRLLYVGWTRARDRLVLAGRYRVFWRMPLAVLGGLVKPPYAGKVLWAGLEVPVKVRSEAPLVAVRRDVVPGAAASAAGPREHPPARLAPSSLASADCRIGSEERLGGRLSLKDGSAMELVGDAMHAFLAADRPLLPGALRRELAQDCLALWEAEGALGPEDLVEASDRLRRWVERRWPGAVWHRELPVSRLLESGTVVQGVADLVLEVGGGLVVIDHKTFPGGLEGARSEAASYGGQLRAYAEALRAASGREILGTWIHMPVVGMAVEVVVAGVERGAMIY